ncbi:hypothetical protein CUJ83_09865 [Methanocella sp. CWC-04]|uniref:DUF3829 domain-containing protein n=1 Tax=Methanooceanicella nereidis TaxID=2052831 RepID=A0AAP2W5B5_9EURY|nr:hypothetical protein [Methanocella sp. CWC-04]MCD1295305.1 hypothetical protein [Methanocella sp. CWC-04]
MRIVGYIIFLITLAVIAAGCSSTSQTEPAVSAEQKAAYDDLINKTNALTGPNEKFSRIDSEIKNANFLPPPSLNNAMVDDYTTDVNAYISALEDFKLASQQYKTYLDSNGSEYAGVMDNESAVETQLKNAGDLKEQLELIGDWLDVYDAWNQTNVSVTEKINEMSYFASFNDPYSKFTPQDGIDFFNSARPVIIEYLTESGNLINETDTLISVMDEGNAKSTLIQLKSEVTSENDWLRTNYNEMVGIFNSLAGAKYGMMQSV